MVEVGNLEECDEGEGNDDQGSCTRSCRLARCGDGFVHSGVEVCDAGEGNDDQGSCTRACAPPRCGDGIVQLGEICDAGEWNQSPGYGSGCSTECRHLGRCGDGIVQSPQEACDDGNGDDDDACPRTCQAASCGDGYVWAGVEACDDGNTDDGDACTSPCAPALCGDGFVWVGVEECDDGGGGDADECRDSCVWARCGDGVVHAGVEECDDGNDDPEDGCNEYCAADRLVFVTEGVWSAKGVVGFDGAAQECQKIAASFGHPQPHHFLAWISDGVNSPDTRFTHSRGRYVLPSGEVVAVNWDDLTDGALAHAIDRTRAGTPMVEVPVFTATRPDGTAYPDGHCDGWTASSLETHARHGYSDLADGGWSAWDGVMTCADLGHLYCFEAL